MERDLVDIEDERLDAFWGVQVTTWLEGRLGRVMAPHHECVQWMQEQRTLQRVQPKLMTLSRTFAGELLSDAFLYPWSEYVINDEGRRVLRTHYS